MAGEVLVDALPYIDAGYDEPGVKQGALSLVEEECRRYKPSKNYLEIFGPINYHLFETDLLKNEFRRMEQRLPMEMLNMKRYELPPPPPSKQTDASAWLECVENSRSQLEHQASRIFNLELMSDYGANTWRIYNQTLKTLLDSSEKQLEEIRKQIQHINLSRKSEQTSAGAKLRSLEQNWNGLVSKNYEIECALVELEKEVSELKRKKEAENLCELKKKKEAEKLAELKDIAVEQLSELSTKEADSESNTEKSVTLTETATEAMVVDKTTSNQTED